MSSNTSERSSSDLTKPFYADTLRCPKCDQPLRRVTAGHGSFIMTCPNRVNGVITAGGTRSDHCGQTVHVLAAEGVAVVLPIDKKLFLKYQRAYPGAAIIYAEAGILPTRIGPDGVPTHDCRICHTPTKLFDLYGGECRGCAASTPVPE